MLEALFDAIDRLIRRLFRLPEASRSRGPWAAFESATCAGMDAVIKTPDAGIEFGVVKPAMALARVPGAMVRGAAAAGRFAGGAVLGVAGAVGDVLGALAPARPVSPTDLARQAIQADDAPMPTIRPAVSSRPRLGDGRTTSYLLQGNALGVAVQDLARARAMGDASAGARNPCAEAGPRTGPRPRQARIRRRRAIMRDSSRRTAGGFFTAAPANMGR